MNIFSSDHFPFPMHSIHIVHKGKIIQEQYFPPYEKCRKHRMFSVTKAFTSLAIGALIAEGRLSIDEQICKRFPEYTPADASPYLTRMRVRDLLMMRSCHKVTTYKVDPSQHWVRSFFTAPPDHAPGRVFKYDTSAAHTLAALVQKISGKGVLDYLRDVFLDRIGFSGDAYILKDPFGCEIGGSGLVAYPEDLLKTAHVLLSLYRGTWESDHPDLCGCADSIYDRSFWKRYAAYVREAMSFQSATLHEGKTVDEMQGYGYQFWMLRNGGVMMYGMGGQYMVLYPDAELILITTADTQSVQGGTQYILDEIRRVALLLAPELNDRMNPPCIPDTDAADVLQESGSDPTTAKRPDSASDKSITKYYGTYRLSSNANGFHTFTLDASELILESEKARFVFPYGIGTAYAAKETVYGQQIYTSAHPQPDGSLYLRSQILDDYVGCIHFMINGNEDQITLSLRKVEESLYSEFNCFLNGVRL